MIKHYNMDILKKMFCCLSVVFCLELALTGIANGKDLYVEYAYEKGGCSSSGSDDTYDPRTRVCGSGSRRVFSTLQGAMDAMTGGDDIFMRGDIEKGSDGRYKTAVYGKSRLTGEGAETNTVVIDASKSGSENDYSTLQSYPGEWVVLDGENNCGTYSSRPLGVISSGGSGWKVTRYWLFERFEVVRGAHASGEYASGMSIAHGPFKIRYLYIHDNTCKTNYYNPAGLRGGVLQNSVIEYSRFNNNGYKADVNDSNVGIGHTDSGNFAHVCLFADYNQDEIADKGYNGSDGLRGNVFRYNLVENGQKGFKQKGHQFFSSRRSYSDAYSSYGDKVHNNVFRNLDNYAIEVRQDFVQVYNNMAVNTEGITVGFKYRQYKFAVYNNTIINGGTYDPAAHAALAIVTRKLFDFEDNRVYGYVFNNLIDSVPDEWFTEEVSLGVAVDNHAVDYSPEFVSADGTVFFDFQNNYVHNSANNEVLTVHRNNARNPMGESQFESEFKVYELFTASKSTGNALYDSNDYYSIRGAHSLEDGLTIANGGVKFADGAKHPLQVIFDNEENPEYKGRTVPGYVGAQTPSGSSGWVDVVTTLEDLAILRDSEPTTPLPPGLPSS